MRVTSLLLFTLLFNVLSAKTYVWESSKCEKINEYCEIFNPQEVEQTINSQNIIKYQFEECNSNLINIGVAKKGIWLKLDIENQSNKPTILIEINNHFVDSVALYSLKNEHLNYEESVGALAKTDHNIFEVNIPKNTKRQFLFYMIDNGPFRFDINIWNKDFYERKQQESATFWAFICGLLTFIVVLNLLFFFSIKEKLYLVYAGLVTTYIYTLLGNAGYIHPLINKIESFNNFDLRSTFNLFLVFFTMQFLKYLFPSIPKIFKKLILIISLSPLLLILQFFNFFGSDFLGSLCFILFYVVSVVSILVFLSIVIFSLKNNLAGGRWLLLAYSPIIFLYILNILRAFHIINIGFVFTSYMLYAFLFEILIMTITVCLRFISYKSDKEKYQFQLVNQQVDFSNKLVYAQEQERKNIAVNLHDGVGQVVSGLKMRLSNFLLKNKEVFSSKQQQNINQFIDLAETAYQEVRNISHELMPKSLQENGLLLALETLMQLSFSDTEFEWTYEPLVNTEQRFEEEVEIALYRVTQEAITNIIKYSKADRIAVQLYLIKKTLFLIIEDNGIGFDENAEMQGLGLKNMETRINIINGKFNLASSNKGTVITIKVEV